MIDFSGDHDLSWLPGEHAGHIEYCCMISPERNLAVNSNGFPLIVDREDPKIREKRLHLVGTIGDIVYFACRIPQNNQLQWSPLRSVLINLSNDQFLPISRAAQILDFYDDHAFCGRCGNRTVPSNSDRGLRCTVCNFLSYPRVSPSIIVLVTRADYILLAKAPRFKDDMYSTLAGYVEAGESAEHACHREIFEEVGVIIEPPIYQASQSWPFKHSLMLGYRAKWKSGEIITDGIEIIDAQWFHLSDLPKLPPRASIARGLIDTYRIEQEIS